MMNKYLPALQAIAESLKNVSGKWLFGSSTSLMLHGIKIEPHDIDVVVDSTIFVEAYSHLKDLGLDQANISTQKAKGAIKNIPAELISFDLSHNEIILVDYEGMQLPVNTLESELSYYKDRPGKDQQVKLIEARLKELKGV